MCAQGTGCATCYKDCSSGKGSDLAGSSMNVFQNLQTTVRFFWKFTWLNYTGSLVYCGTSSGTVWQQMWWLLCDLPQLFEFVYILCATVKNKSRCSTLSSHQRCSWTGQEKHQLAKDFLQLVSSHFIHEKRTLLPFWSPVFTQHEKIRQNSCIHSGGSEIFTDLLITKIRLLLLFSRGSQYQHCLVRGTA